MVARRDWLSFRRGGTKQKNQAAKNAMLRMQPPPPSV